MPHICRKLLRASCSTAAHKARRGASKHEVRERRQRALELRAHGNLRYADIARLTGYKTESGVWRAINAERRQQLRVHP